MLKSLIRTSSLSLVLTAGLLAAPGASAEAAAGPASLTLSPTSKSVTHGAVVPLTVNVNTGGRPVNAVQFFLTVSGVRLDCSSIVPTSTWPTHAAQSCSGSTMALAVGTAPGAAPVNGKVKVATVNVQTSVKGRAVVGFDRSRSLVVTSDTNEDILGSTNTATITVG